MLNKTLTLSKKTYARVFYKLSPRNLEALMMLSFSSIEDIDACIEYLEQVKLQEIQEQIANNESSFKENRFHDEKEIVTLHANTLKTSTDFDCNLVTTKTHKEDLKFNPNEGYTPPHIVVIKGGKNPNRA